MSTNNTTNPHVKSSDDKKKPEDDISKSSSNQHVQNDDISEDVVQTTADVPTDNQDIQLLEISSLKKQLEELDIKWRRSVADYHNFKKQQERDKQEWIAFSNSALLKELLPRFDEFDQAISHAPEEIKTTKWYEGLLLIRKNFEKTFEAIGVEEIQAKGEQFTPHRHEAVSQEQSDEHESGTVIAVLQKGYLLKDKVIRPAMVKVAE